MPDATVSHQLELLDSALQAGTITEHSAATIRAWLTEPRYAEFAAELASLIDRAAADPAVWKELDDAYWTVIPFGTGGRRGRMYPVGSNAINDRTIGESAQGLADYVRSVLPAGESPSRLQMKSAAAGSGDQQPRKPSAFSGVAQVEKGHGWLFPQTASCTIAYDTRHRSEHFARLCTEVLLAAGFKVFFLRGVRSTPELSFAVRHTQSTCGIMVTASHNPPSDNAVKVYWAGGVQVLPPHDKGIIDRVMQVDEIRRESFDEGVATGRVVFVEEEIDPAFVSAVLKQASPGPREISILYTPLHGVGATAVVPVLAEAGFEQLRLFGPQAEPSGDFPNVPGHVANPENPAVLSGAIAEARERGDDLVLASDPDADRLGAAAPLTRQPGADWQTFTGNQLSALLCRQAITGRKARGASQPDDYVVTTLVTTGLVRRIAEAHGLRCDDSQLVGFKWICSTIDRLGPEGFVFGTEESHGYLAGTHVRDKDASVAALLMAELTATLKAEGRSPHEELDGLFCRFGCHQERQVSVMLPGASGMDRMKEIMARLRAEPPAAFGGLDIVRTRDQASLTTWTPGGEPEPYGGVAGDLVIFDLAGLEGAGERLTDGRFPPLGNAVAARPSGTEPKIKFYLFAAGPPCGCDELPAAKASLTVRLDDLERDLRQLAGV